jgi:hypothetical protein
MHYVVFLLQHGMHPYRQIIDLNMPGSYGVDWFAGCLLGTSAHAWRGFDWLLMTAAGAAIVSITCCLWHAPTAGTHDENKSTRVWSASPAGYWAAGLFALLHIGSGVAQAAQRDFILAVLLLVGYAALIPAVRQGAAAVSRPVAILLMAFWGVCCGVAATIKPQAILLPAILLALLWMRGRRCKNTTYGLLIAGAAGVAMPLLVMMLWLIVQGSLRAFFHTGVSLMEYHAGMARHTSWFLISHAVPSVLWPIVLAAIWLRFTRRRSRTFSETAILLGIAFGFFSFYIQGKAYPYQREPLVAFLLVFAAFEVARVMTARPQTRLRMGAAVLTLLYGFLWVGPSSTAKALRYDWRSTPTLDALSSDIANLSKQPEATFGAPGAQGLQRQVQCMDTMAGCITVLDRMQLVQATGFLYDCYFFAPDTSSVQSALRARFLAEIDRHPPGVFVITDQWCLNLPDGYAKLAQWPAFSRFLASRYTLAVQRSWPARNTRNLATSPFGYHLYLRKEKQR